MIERLFLLVDICVIKRGVGQELYGAGLFISLCLRDFMW